MVDVLDEGGSGVEVAVGVTVADLIDLAEDGGYGVGCGEAGAVSHLTGGAGVVDVGGHAADALLVVDDIVDAGAYVSVELGGDGVVRGGGHFLLLECVNALMC